MSFECNDCHKIATGKDIHDVHFSGSTGPCESCHRVGETAHCQCQGDWPAARLAAAKEMTEKILLEPLTEQALIALYKAVEDSPVGARVSAAEVAGKTQWRSGKSISGSLRTLAKLQLAETALPAYWRGTDGRRPRQKPLRWTITDLGEHYLVAHGKRAP